MRAEGTIQDEWDNVTEPATIINDEIGDSDLVEKVKAELREEYDPDIGGVNMFDLGLFLRLDLYKDKNGGICVDGEMVFTSPNCPFADQMVRGSIEAIKRADDRIGNAYIQPRLDVPYNVENASVAAQLQMGLLL